MRKRRRILICMVPQVNQAMVDGMKDHFMTLTVDLASSSMGCLFKTLGPSQARSTREHITRQSCQRVMRSHT